MDAVTAGVEEFHNYFTAALASNPDVVWRTAGKATKANPNGEDAAFWDANGPEWVKKYHQWRTQNPEYRIWHTPDGTPAIELEIAVTVPGSSIVLKGSVDRVFTHTVSDRLKIVDLKSGKTAQPSPMQLGFYRLAILEQFGVDIRWGAFYDARTGMLDQEYDLDQFSPDLVSRWIRNMSRTLELRDFTPNVSRDCAWCSYKEDHCYVWNPSVPRPDFGSDVEGR